MYLCGAYTCTSIYQLHNIIQALASCQTVQQPVVVRQANPKCAAHGYVISDKVWGLILGRAVGPGGPSGQSPPHILTQQLTLSQSGVCTPGLSSPGVPGIPHILADQLTLSQPGGADYAHHITTGTPGFSDLLTALPRWWQETYRLRPNHQSSQQASARHESLEICTQFLYLQ